jgi:hypothetical protein
LGQSCPSVSINVNTIVNRYVGPPGDTNAELYPLRPQNLEPSWIDSQDCKDDIRLQFTILVSGLPCTDTIQVWAGTTDCTQVSARQANSGAPRCWLVTPPGEFQMSVSTTADIRAQDIVAFIQSAEPPTIYSPSGANACQHLVNEAGRARCGEPLRLYFMAIESDGETVDGTSGEYGYDFGAEFVRSDGGSCRSSPADAGAVDAGSDSARSGGGSFEGPLIGACGMAPGRSSGVGMAGGAAIAAVVIARRRRRGRARPR